MKDNTTEIFKNAPVPKAVISNIIPSIVSMIMVLVYNLADTFFIGQTKNAYGGGGFSCYSGIFIFYGSGYAFWNRRDFADIQNVRRGK